MSCLCFRSRSDCQLGQLGQLLHFNVESFKVACREVFKSFITFIDDFSKFTSIYSIKLKSDASVCFETLDGSFEMETSTNIMALESENGGNYITKIFSSHISNMGICHKKGPPHSPQLDQTRESAHSTVGNQVRCALLGASGLEYSWVKTLQLFFHTLTPIPCHKPAGLKWPNVVLSLPIPDVSQLHPFGCKVWLRYLRHTVSLIWTPKDRMSILLYYLTIGMVFNWGIWTVVGCEEPGSPLSRWSLPLYI